MSSEGQVLEKKVAGNHGSDVFPPPGETPQLNTIGKVVFRCRIVIGY